MKLRLSFILGATVWTGCGAGPPAPPVSPSAVAFAAAPEAIEEVASDDRIQVEEKVVIDAPIERVWSIFDDPQAYRYILPLVRSVEPRGKDPRGALRLGLVQGVSIASGSYTVLIYKVRPYELELSIDHAYPSILREGRGRVELKNEADGKTRVSYWMSADLGDRWILHFFKDRIRDALTQPPYLLKSYVEGRR